MYLFDNLMGASVYMEAPDWDAAERLACDEGLVLVGQHVPIREELQRPPLALTIGETKQ